MIKLTNYKTFTDEVFEEVFVVIDNLGMHGDGEGYRVNYSFSMYADENQVNRLEHVPNTLECEYELDSKVNAIKFGYLKLNTLSTFVSSVKV